ncbi:MAG: AAA family ATPase [Algisphaera sp.]
MRLISITTQDFRGLIGTTHVTFGHGLHVVHGPNETGKSTLFEAIQTALTLKAKVTGSPLDHITSRHGGHPAVTLVFEHHGATHTLVKQFQKARGSTRLDITPASAATQSFAGDEAEAQLRTLLQMGEPGRGAPKPEQLGIWPLLWSHQTRTHTSPTQHMSLAAQGTLGQRLSELSGSVLAGSQGDALVDAAQAEHNRYFTKSGKEAASGPLATARVHAQQSHDAAQELNERDAQHASTTRRYAEISLKQTQLDAQRPAKVKHASQTAETAHAAIAAQQHVDRATQQLETAELHKQNAIAHVATRAKARKQITQLTTAAQSTQKTVQETAHAATQHHTAEPDLTTAEKNATTTLVQHLKQSRAARQRVETLRQQADAQCLQAALAQAEAIDTQRRDAQHKANAETLTSKIAKTLETLTRHAEDTALELKAAAAHVRIESLASKPNNPPALNLNGHPLTLTTPHNAAATEPLHIELPDQLRITVTPGGDEISNRRDAAANAARKLAHALEQANVANARDAAQRVAEAKRHDLAAREHDKLLKVHAPNGLDALRDSLQQHALNDTPPNNIADVLAQATEQVQTLDTADHALRLAETAARTRLQAHRDTAQQLNQGQSLAQANAQRADDDLTAATTELEKTITQDGPDDTLAQHALAATQNHQNTATEVEKAKKSAAATPVDIAQENHDRAQRTLDNLDTEAAQLRDEQIRLETRLQSADHLGLNERLAAANTARDQAHRILQTESRRARAAKTLSDTLNTCREQARAAHLAPLQKEVAQLLPILFPGAAFQFNESFDLTGLKRPHHTHHQTDTFSQLSAGTQEQVGLVLRLALAKVLANDQPLPLLLDDTLVATDDTRFDRIATLLNRCCPPLQIILATCNWPRHRSLGIPAENVIDLESIRNQDS